MVGPDGLLSSRRRERTGHKNSDHMNAIWYAIGHFLQKTFNWLLVPFGWGPVVLFSVMIAFGLGYWMWWQGKYNRRAKEKGEYI